MIKNTDILMLIENGCVVKELRDTVNRLINGVDVNNLGNYRFRDGMITAEAFCHIFSVRKSNYDNKGIYYSGLDETLGAVSSLDKSEKISAVLFFYETNNYMVLFRESKGSGGPLIIGFYCWERPYVPS